MDWHAAQVSDVLSALKSGRDGLTESEAARRLKEHGPNQLPRQRPVSALAILAAQFNSVITLLLVVAAVTSWVFRDRLEALAIAAVLVINAAIGFITELRARRAMEALLDLDVPAAAVVRDGRLNRIDARNLVPGDVVELETGRAAPADVRLISASDLSVNEAALTGESMPAEKSVDAKLDPDTPLADRETMAYKSTLVVRGVARGVVTATGPRTEVGRIGLLVGAVQHAPTPLERRLETLGHRLVWLTLAVAGVVAVLGIVQGLPVTAVIETAIALAVAAVPEALPAVATVALAVGVARMAKRHAFVRRLPSVESLGSTTVVCTDKTRTLTSGDMKVVRVWAAGHAVDLQDGDDLDLPERARPLVLALLEAAARASRAQAATVERGDGWRGDPVDLAMLNAARRAGVSPPEDRPPAGLLPFSSDRKLMAAFHRIDGRTLAFAKGAPRAILSICRRVDTAEGPRDLTDASALEIEAANEAFAADGFRVLAVASGEVAGPSAHSLKGLTFAGLVALADPPAAGVKETIHRLRAAGLRTVMLTGDQRLTAEAVGRALGLLESGDRAIDGREIAASPPADLVRHAAFSRITPEHKLSVVRAFQSKGEIVAMLGDGVNDAAALKQADVGVAMGQRGTDAAKQAAAIVLGDDRFETIAVAVEEGRVIFDNIRKFVFYLFSCNLAEVMVVLGASVAGLPLPFLPLQLLWINLVTDTLPALSLAMEPADEDVMQRPPRDPDQAILSRAFLASISFYALLITGSTLAVFVVMSDDVDRARTGAFMTIAIAQILHLGNARSRGAVVALPRVFANKFAISAVVMSIGLQVITTQVPWLRSLLRVVPLSWPDWLLIGTLASLPAVVGQLIKILRRARRDS